MKPLEETRLLIAGIPGTGKTFLGQYLAARYGFQHVDMEAGETLRSFVQDRPAFLARLAPKVVITWGFHPGHSPDVLFLREHGYFLVWFDGDRASALRSFIARDTVPEAAFYAQMFNIEKQGVVREVAPQAFVNPFRDGVFRPPDELAEELLTLWREKNAA